MSRSDPSVCTPQGVRASRPSAWRPALFLALLLLPLRIASAAPDALAEIRASGVLRWGADAISGAPYVFREDPDRSESVVGFEVDLADALAKELGVRAQLVQDQWDMLVPGLLKGRYAVVLNGLEITEDRRKEIAFSKPYYVAHEQLTVRAGDEGRIRSLADLKGRRVGTLRGALAERILERADGIEPVGYDDQNTPYKDLELGRLGAVLMDYPIALYYGKPSPMLRMAGEPAGEALYGIGVRPSDASLVAALDAALDRLIRAGTLRRIYEAWGLWNAATARLFGDAWTGEEAPAPRYEAFLRSGRGDPSFFSRYLGYLVFLLRGAATTLLLSVAAMAIAMALGLALAALRLYGGPTTRAAAVAYIELVRGTPLLIQLYLLYFGLPSLGVNLPPLLAGWIGLGLNYAAYEAENYRAGILAVPRHQMEAALSLGLTARQAFRTVILPQAVRVSLPTVTNDFIALLKDSSIVSMISITELASCSRVLTGAKFDYLGIALLTAALYFLMGWPFAWMARRLERRLSVHLRATSA
jgi:polar amino acid transport system substrate-binding protein